MGKFNKARQQFGFLNAWTVFLAEGSQNPRTFYSQKNLLINVELWNINGWVMYFFGFIIIFYQFVFLGGFFIVF